MFQRIFTRAAVGTTKSLTIPKFSIPTQFFPQFTQITQQQCRMLTTTTHRFPLLQQQFIPKTSSFLKNFQNFQNSSNFVINTTKKSKFHIKLKINRHKRDRIGYCSRPHHASVKRFWQTGSGRLMRFKSGMNHKRRRKTKNQLRRLSQRVEVPKQAYRRLTKMMMLRPYAQYPPGMSRPVNKFWQPPKDAAKVQKKRWC